MIDLVEKIKFKDFMDFINKRKQLRIYYVFLTTEEKKELKKYVYSLKYKNYIKDVIWRYFNEPKGSVDYVLETEVLHYLKVYNRNKKSIDEKY